MLAALGDVSASRGSGREIFRGPRRSGTEPEPPQPPPGGARRAELRGGGRHRAGCCRPLRGEGRRVEEEGAGKGGCGAEPGPALRVRGTARSPLPTARKRPRSAFPEDEDFLPPIERCPGVSTQPWGSRRAGRVHPPTPPSLPAHGSAQTPFYPLAGRDPRSRPTGGGWGTAARRPLPGPSGAASSKTALRVPEQREFGNATSARVYAASRPRYPCGSGGVGRFPSAVPPAGNGRAWGALLLSSESRGAASGGVFPTMSPGDPGWEFP